MDVVKSPGRFDIVLVDLDPTLGSEIRKTRPCLVVSPDEMNRHIRTVDKARLIRRLGTADQETARAVAHTLVEMFALSEA
jgi:mRNA-degrading endonuclease toxin of MazEF toxin-antitoxin module